MLYIVCVYVHFTESHDTLLRKSFERLEQGLWDLRETAGDDINLLIKKFVDEEANCMSLCQCHLVLGDEVEQLKRDKEILMYRRERFDEEEIALTEHQQNLVVQLEVHVCSMDR